VIEGASSTKRRMDKLETKNAREEASIFHLIIIVVKSLEHCVDEKVQWNKALVEGEGKTASILNQYEATL
jgi:hypothetical protein